VENFVDSSNFLQILFRERATHLAARNAHVFPCGPGNEGLRGAE